ncbi:MAG: DUF5602 domain-containing protein [Thermodesulfobacteriota bacterium]
MNKYKIIKRGILVLLFTAMVVYLFGCSEVIKSSQMAGTYKGSSKTLGDGIAYAFATLDDSGKPISIGVRMSEISLNGLQSEPPNDADTAWETIIPLPKEATAAGYDHIGIDWNPRGHIPDGIYNKPHFDFHFYMISQAERNNITAKGEDLVRINKQPTPEYMPEGYILPEGTEVPKMGAHAIDPSAPEFNNKPFSKTFIYGFYDGQLVFLEPMMTKDFLTAKTNSIDLIKLPKFYAKNGYYPTAYSVKYDVNQREFEIALENLVYR